MSDLEVIQDNTKEWDSNFKSAVRRGLEKIGLVAEGYAKKLCPVDTGRLRNSITHETDDNAVYIGTNVEYAPYVELGTSRTREQPYLRPAAQDHVSQYRQILKDELNK